jgi:hypothetical protein
LGDRGSTYRQPNDFAFCGHDDTMALGMGICGRLLLCAGLLLATEGLGLAAPPASCASKFVGTWTVRVNATGQTYPLIIRPNGTTHITCPLCPSEGTWTCEGNVFRGLEPVSTTSTLSADARTLVGSCCTIARVGAPPALAAKPADAAGSAITASAPKSVSCLAVRAGTPAYKDCDAADFALSAARAARNDYPRVAADQYKHAAAAARRAGDTKLELRILREASGQPSSEPRR